MLVFIISCFTFFKDFYPPEKKKKSMKLIEKNQTTNKINVSKQKVLKKIINIEEKKRKTYDEHRQTEKK